MKKVLLVDDSNTVLMMEQMILKSTGLQIVVAHDGEEAVEKALAESPDVIIMDIMMPKMTGLEACRRLRSQDATRSLPIILVTTKGQGQDIEAGYASGCTDYLTKPIDAVELVAKIKAHLGV